MGRFLASSCRKKGRVWSGGSKREAKGSIQEPGGQQAAGQQEAVLGGTVGQRATLGTCRSLWRWGQGDTAVHPIQLQLVSPVFTHYSLMSWS